MYFTKYLPTESEIEDGDVYKSAHRVRNGKYPYVMFHKNNSTIPEGDNLGKYKLFLFNEDVQIGEISKQALSYVREGDEIEKEDVHFEGWSGMICPDVEEDTLEAYMSHGYVEAHPELKIVCLIKGPCFHYH